EARLDELIQAFFDDKGGDKESKSGYKQVQAALRSRQQQLETELSDAKEELLSKFEKWVSDEKAEGTERRLAVLGQFQAKPTIDDLIFLALAIEQKASWVEEQYPHLTHKKRQEFLEQVRAYLHLDREWQWVNRMQSLSPDTLADLPARRNWMRALVRNKPTG